MIPAPLEFLPPAKRARVLVIPAGRTALVPTGIVGRDQGVTGIT
jgi:hypothetical protein